MPPRREVRGRGQSGGRGSDHYVNEELGGDSVRREQGTQLSAVGEAPRVQGGGEVPPVAPAVPQPADIDDGLVRQIVAVVTAMTGRVQPQPQPQPPVRRESTNVEKFRKMNPPTYDGVTDPEVVESFLDECEKILEALEIEEFTTRITLTAFQLAGRASTWWKSIKGAGVHVGLTWAQFKDRFRDHFLPQSVRDAKREEFMFITQGSMSVIEYERRYSELSRYAPELVSTTRLKCRHFEKGLRTGLRIKMVMLRINDYAELVDRAIAVERELNEIKAHNKSRRERNVGRQRDSEDRKRQKTGASTFQGSQTQSSGATPRPPRKSSTTAPGQIVCHKCGKPGHVRANCPRRRGRRESVDQQGSEVTVDNQLCYRCGQQGHIQRYCPLRQTDIGRRVEQESQSYQGSRAPTPQVRIQHRGSSVGTSQGGVPQLPRGTPLGQRGGRSSSGQA